MVVVEVLVVVVLVAARGCDRRAGAVVGIGCGRIVGSRGRYRDAVLGSAREPGLRGALVAACEDGKTAFDRAVGRPGVMQEVVEGVLLQRGVRRPLLFVLEARRPPFVAVGAARDIAPAALQDDGAVVGRVFDGPDGRQRVADRVAREYLAAHDLHARDVAVAAGDRADADAVVVLRGDYARYVRAVPRVVDVIP